MQAPRLTLSSQRLIEGDLPTDHISGPGRAIGWVCVSVGACVGATTGVAFDQIILNTAYN